MTTNATQAPKDLVGFLDYYLVEKAPFRIPDNGREWIVRYGPWIALVLMLFSLPALLVALGIGATLMPFGGVGYATGFTYFAMGAIVQIALTLAALPGLFARKVTGWQLLFYATLVSLVFSLLSGSIVGGIIGAVISLFILFQVRPLYHA
jgi:hypothetical protein